MDIETRTDNLVQVDQNSKLRISFKIQNFFKAKCSIVRRFATDNKESFNLLYAILPPILRKAAFIYLFVLVASPRLFYHTFPLCVSFLFGMLFRWLVVNHSTSRLIADRRLRHSSPHDNSASSRARIQPRFNSFEATPRHNPLPGPPPARPVHRQGRISDYTRLCPHLVPAPQPHALDRLPIQRQISLALRVLHARKRRFCMHLHVPSCATMPNSDPSPSKLQ